MKAAHYAATIIHMYSDTQGELPIYYGILSTYVFLYTFSCTSRELAPVAWSRGMTLYVGVIGISGLQ